MINKGCQYVYNFLTYYNNYKKLIKNIQILSIKTFTDRDL